jgi:hypothetical protein
MNSSNLNTDRGLPSPPRLLIWIVLLFFTAIVLAAIAAVGYFTSDGRLSRLILPLALAAVAFPVISVLSALALRRGLPRRMWLFVLIFWLIVFGVGAVGGVQVYRGLEPRYQAEMLTYVPFMEQYMRPTPQGGVIPTAAVTSALSPADLLAMPLASPSEAAPAATAPPTATPAPSETALPTATTAPTEAAVLPTQAPPPTDETMVLTSSTRSNRPASAFLYGFRWERQEWNNCGPTNITIALSHFGWQETASYAEEYLRPNTEDKNVSPGELVSFVNNHTGVRAITRIGGDTELLRTLIAAGFPVLVETTFTPEGYDWIGHYQTVVGYDDNNANFYVYDSYLGVGDGSGLPEPYAQFDRDWQAFNRVLIVLYEQDREAELVALLGDRADLTLAAEHALQVAQDEARANPTSPFAWFNMGSALVKLGDYERAAAAFDEASRRELPFRMLWYQFGPFEAYFNVGRYDDVMALVQNNLTNGAQYVEETHYWQGRVYEARGMTAEASAAYQRALAHNPLYAAARERLDALA